MGEDNNVEGDGGAAATAAATAAAAQPRSERGISGQSMRASERAQAVFIRREDEVGAMSWDQRMKARAKNFFLRQPTQSADNNNDNADEEDGASGEGGAGGAGGGGGKAVQYRLEATRRTPQQNGIVYLLSCCGLFGGQKRTTSGLAVGIHPNQKLAMYLHWMFRVNFGFLFFVMCVMFFLWVIIFAGFIAIAGEVDKHCVRIGDNYYGAEGTKFADVFALSWTTFSTVGYGSTYPALMIDLEETGTDNPTNCFIISFVLSLESLLGVLYSGFCGAILFGKVLRIQSHAQVMFSDPIVIRYGSGVRDNREFEAHRDNTGDEDGGGDDGDNADKCPCPVLEFRIVNRLYSEIGGEIMDATLNVVANVDANDADPMLQQSLSTAAAAADGLYGQATESSQGTEATLSEGSSRPDIAGFRQDSKINSLQKRLFNPLISFGRKDHQSVDEDPSARLVSKHIFSKMLIEASDHPFFKRVWLARHVLDEHSPVLKPRARRQIRRNGGSWPERLNTADAIRNNLQFNQILVSLNGVSNVSASDVYAQKIYDFVDINIGYQFVNILYRDADGALGVDTDLINDVREQNGGGGEPLIIGD